MDCMIAAANVQVAYRSRSEYRDKDGNENWAEWANKNPALNEILVAAAAESEGQQDAIAD